MKKLLSCILSAALIMLLVAPLTAFAQPATPSMPLWEEWGYSSLEEFLDDMHMTEEDYYELERDIREWEEWLEAERINAFVEMGGTPGVLNVMFNGEFIKFPDVVPEIVNNTAYVPARPFFEAMGAEMSFDPQSRAITAEFPGMSIRLVVGSETVGVTRGAAERMHTIDAAPYIRNNVSYVPVRAVAEALGFDVFWDRERGTAVIIDLAQIAAEIDKDFTIINSLFEMPLSTLIDDGGTYRTVLDALVSMKIFDTLDGDTAANIRANVEVISDGSNFSLVGTFDLSELRDLMLSTFNGMYDVGMAEEVATVFDALSEIEAEIIVNYDEGVIYVKSQLIQMMLPEFPDGAWLAVRGLGNPFGDLSLDDMMGEIGFMSPGFSVGAMIADSTSYQHFFDQVFLYEEIMREAEFAKALMGDAKFTRSGSGYSLITTLDELRSASIEFGQFVNTSEFLLRLDIAMSGDEVTGISGGFVFREGWFLVVRYDCEFDIRPDRVQFSLEVHERNSSIVLIEFDMSTSESPQPVPKAPPAGSTVIDIEELFDDDLSVIEPLLFTLFAP